MHNKNHIFYQKRTLSPSGGGTLYRLNEHLLWLRELQIQTAFIWPIFRALDELLFKVNMNNKHIIV